MIKNSEVFIKELAEKHGISEFMVRQAVFAPFHFMRKVMAKKEFEGFMFSYLGKIIVQPNVRKYMKLRLDERNSKSNSKQDILERGEKSKEETGSL